MKEFIKFSMFMVFLFCVIFAILNAFYGERFSKEITIYFNGNPLHVSVDGSGLESAGGHNYQTGIIYEMRRNGKDVIINTSYDPTPPQPAFSDSTNITFTCDDKPCEMIGDTVVLFTIAEGDTVKIGTRLYFIGMKP